MAVESRHVRYVFADVVRFTEDRTLEAQVEIIAALNLAFTEAVGDLEALYLPTGDGICVAILATNASADIHLVTALRILEKFHHWSSKASSNRSAELRVAINESVDAVIVDINGNRNLAGAGINLAQRLMTIADGNQIIVVRAAYETLHVRDQYVRAFREMKAEIKHGHVVVAYQFTGSTAPYLNIEIPLAVQRAEPIELEMTEQMSRPGGYSTSGMAQAIYAATERWRDEMTLTFARLFQSLTPEQREALAAAQRAWDKFYDLEGKFLGALRQTVHGTMFRVFGASILKSLVRGRTRGLQHYIDEWVACSPTYQNAINAPQSG
jgi:hypothetical protein